MYPDTRTLLRHAFEAEIRTVLYYADRRLPDSYINSIVDNLMEGETVGDMFDELDGLINDAVFDYDLEEASDDQE